MTVLRTGRSLSLIVPLAAAGAMKEEVELSPKPGLVDRFDNGPHRDMDLSLFLRSADAVAPYLTAISFATPADLDSSRVLPLIRPVGREAEKVMYTATGGVNTHKGQIFSLGVCTAASVRKGTEPFGIEKILDEAGEICRGLSRELKGSGKPESHGAGVYRSTGSKGARGEAEAGFPSVRYCSYPAYQTARQEGLGHEEAALQALLHLMLKVEDSNVLHRRGLEGLEIVRREAAFFLNSGGMFHPGAYDLLDRMNRLFIRENISPGGCADLLALTMFLIRLEAQWDG